MGEARSIISEILGLDLSRPTGKASASKYDDEGGPEACSICFTVGLRCQRGGPQMLPCGHTFHALCISDWFSWEANCGRKRTCPLCRGIAPDEAEGTQGAHTTHQACGKSVARLNSVTRLRTAVEIARAQAA